MTSRKLVAAAVGFALLAGCAVTTTPTLPAGTMPHPVEPTDLPGTALARISSPTPLLATSTATIPSSKDLIRDAVSLAQALRLQLLGKWQAKYAAPVWSPNSSLLAFETEEGDNQFVALVRLSDPAQHFRYPIPTAAWALAFSPDSQTLAVVHKFCWPFRFLDIESGEFTEAGGQDCAAGGIWTSYTPKGDYIYMLDAEGSPEYGDSSRVSVCRVAGDVSCRVFKGMTGLSGHFVLLDGGNILAPVVDAEDSTFVYLWGTDNGELLCTIDGGWPATNQQGSVLALPTDSQGLAGIEVWDPTSCTLMGSIEDRGIPLAVDATGRYVVAYHERSIRVLDFESGVVVSDLRVPESLDWATPAQIAVSPDWRFVAIQGMTDGDEFLSLFAAVH